MAKSKERLDAEATHQMTSKQKLSNFWFYHKWFIFGGGFLIIMIVVFTHDILSNVKPDYTIAVLTPHMVQESSLAEMEAAILPYIDDRNGDGKTTLLLSTYNVVVGGEESKVGDPMAHAAAVTRLSGDIQMGESVLFLTDDVEAYQGNLDLFCYNDNSLPPEGGVVDYGLMGVPIADCPPLAKIDTSSISPKSFTLVKRAVPPKQKESFVSYYQDSLRLFDALTSY